jgi:hypothetical protein
MIRADPAGKLFAAIGAGNLRAWVDRRDAAGQAALSNLVLSERQLLIWDALTGCKPVTPKAASG